MTSVLPSQRPRDVAMFVAVGAGVAVVGHSALHALVALGMEAWLANVVQTAVTLELNYALNRLITWRRHVAGSTVSGWQPWRRFHVARAAGLALNLLAFPLLAPRLGITAAYWVLFAVCGALNYVTDRHWSFAGRHTPRRTSLVVRAALLGLLFALAAWHSADFVILLVSMAMLAVTVTTLVFQLYKGRCPEQSRELSDLVGNREFIIDTSRNGLGPPPEGQWCNVTKQALGQRPTTRPNLPGVAALLWVKRPGESDGLCGGERTYGFSPRQAERLIENATWVAEPVIAALPGR